ncbi:unnamed protein product [Boreogadus saida]
MLSPSMASIISVSHSVIAVSLSYRCNISARSPFYLFFVNHAKNRGSSSVIRAGLSLFSSLLSANHITSFSLRRVDEAGWALLSSNFCT